MCVSTRGSWRMWTICSRTGLTTETKAVQSLLRAVLVLFSARVQSGRRQKLPLWAAVTPGGGRLLQVLLLCPTQLQRQASCRQWGFRSGCNWGRYTAGELRSSSFGNVNGGDGWRGRDRPRCELPGLAGRCCRTRSGCSLRHGCAASEGFCSRVSNATDGRGPEAAHFVLKGSI